MSIRPRALVADDEPAIRSLVTLFLKSEYDIITATDGLAAENALMTNPGLAVAVIDCDMPRMSGPDVLTSARAAGCCIPVLLVSGRANPASRYLEGDPLSAFLTKPFSRAQFVVAVAAITSG